MTRPPEQLPDWLQAELGPTLRLATALTGSTQGAEHLVADALAHDHVWAVAEEGYDLTARLRVAVVRTFLGSPLGRSTPPPPATGLDALTGPVRSALVLRDSEQLTGAEIASILDRPGKRVAGELAAIPPGAHDTEITQLAALAPAAGAVAERFVPARRAVRRSRRRRSGLLALAAAVVAVAVAVPTTVLPRLPVDVRTAGTWRFSHELVLRSGWTLVSRSMDAETETSTVRVPSITDRPVECRVLVRVRDDPPSRDGKVSGTQPVHGRRAEILTQAGNMVTLSWEYATGAWASAACDDQSAVPASLLREIAAATRFRDVRQRLPFLLTGLPTDYRIATVSESYDTGYAPLDSFPFVLLEPPEKSYRASLVIGPDFGSTDELTSAGECLPPAQAVCVFAFRTNEQIPGNPSVLRRVVATSIGLVQVAADPTDRSTWFDAIDLPG